jgi:hypothetical protein
VRLVVHAQPPMSMTGWYQESGRAGRDGAPARSVVYYTAAEEEAMLSLVQKPKPPPWVTKAEDKKAAAELSRKAVRAVVEACRQPRCRRAALLRYFGEASTRAPMRGSSRCAPTGGGGPGGGAGCDACADPDAAERGIAAVACAKLYDNQSLTQLRSGDIDLSEFQFGAPEHQARSGDDAYSDGEEGGGSDDDGGECSAFDGGRRAMGKDAARAADVARNATGGGAGAGGALDDAGLARTYDALARAEGSEKSGGRSGLGAALFGHRRPVAAAPAAPPPPPRSVDAEMRAAARSKLQAAMGARSDAAAAAEAAEAKVFAACHARPTSYTQQMRSALLDAQRAASKPATQQQQSGGAVRAPLALAPTQRAFVPPRAAVAPPLPPAPPPAPPAPPPAAVAPAPPAAPPKLKSTRICGPMDAFLSSAKRPKPDV